MQQLMDKGPRFCHHLAFDLKINKWFHFKLCWRKYLPTKSTNPISKNAIKTKNCPLLNHLNFYVTDKSTEKIFPVFSLTNLIVFCKYRMWRLQHTQK